MEWKGHKPKCVEAQRDNVDYGGKYKHGSSDVMERQNLEARHKERV